MKTYRVYVTMSSYLYCDIEAENEAEAREMYEDIDGGAFIETSGSWELDFIEEIK